MPGPLWALSGDSMGTLWVLCGYFMGTLWVLEYPSPDHRRFYLRRIHRAQGHSRVSMMGTPRVLFGYFMGTLRVLLGTSWVLYRNSSTPDHRRFYLRLIDPSDRSVPLCALMGFIMAIGTAGMVSALIGAVQTCGS